MTRIIISVLVVVSLLAISGPLLAADDSATLQPYLSDDVLAVGYVDLTKLSIPAIPPWLAKLGILPESELARATGEAQAMQDVVNTVRDAGAQRVYILLRSTDINHQGPTWVIPFEEDGKPQVVKDLLLQGPQGGYPDGMRPAEIPGHWLIDAHNSLVGGYSQEQANQQLLSQSTHGDLTEAWSAVGDGTVGAVVMGSADSRRVAREMFPPLPPPFDKVDGTLLADGVRWAGVSQDLPPKMSFQLVIETADNATAQTLQEAASKGLQLLAAIPDLQKVVKPAELEPVIDALTPQVSGTRLVITMNDLTGNIERLARVLEVPIAESQNVARRNERMNNFKHIALAMHNYADRNKAFPFPANYDAQGKPLLSWRVHLLPYLEQGALYQQFHLDEPWDSEHNRKLIATTPAMYAEPDPALGKLASAGKTTYVFPVGKGTVHEGPEPKFFKDITDGTSNTIMLVEVTPENAVVWTKPDDWEVDFSDPWKGLRRSDRDWITAGFWDGHVSIIPQSFDAKGLSGMLTPAGGELVKFP